MNESDEESLVTEEIQNNPSPVKQLDVVCKSGVLFLEGNLLLTANEIKFVSAGKRDSRLNPDSGSSQYKTSERGSSNGSSNDARQPTISIPISSIDSVTYEVTQGKTSVSLKWHDDDRRAFGKSNKIQFIQKGVPKRENRLASWIPIIEDSLNNTGSLPSSSIDKETAEKEDTRAMDSPELEKEILNVLDKKDWKGLFQIVGELRDKSKSNYDFDLVEHACQKLAKENRIKEDAGFYRKNLNADVC
jgi:hypothetical protein